MMDHGQSSRLPDSEKKGAERHLSTGDRLAILVALVVQALQAFGLERSILVGVLTSCAAAYFTWMLVEDYFGSKNLPQSKRTIIRICCSTPYVSLLVYALYSQYHDFREMVRIQELDSTNHSVKWLKAISSPSEPRMLYSPSTNSDAKMARVDYMLQIALVNHRPIPIRILDYEMRAASKSGWIPLIPLPIREDSRLYIPAGPTKNTYFSALISNTTYAAFFDLVARTNLLQPGDLFTSWLFFAKPTNDLIDEFATNFQFRIRDSIDWSHYKGIYTASTSRLHTVSFLPEDNLLWPVQNDRIELPNVTIVPAEELR